MPPLCHTRRGQRPSFVAFAPLTPAHPRRTIAATGRGAPHHENLLMASPACRTAAPVRYPSCNGRWLTLLTLRGNWSGTEASPLSCGRGVAWPVLSWRGHLFCYTAQDFQLAARGTRRGVLVAEAYGRALRVAGLHIAAALRPACRPVRTLAVAGGLWLTRCRRHEDKRYGHQRDG